MRFESLGALKAEAGSIDEYCVPSSAKSEALSLLLKSLYDDSAPLLRKAACQELIVSNVDPETIWEQLQTFNKPTLRYLSKRVSKLARRQSEAKKATALQAAAEEDSGAEEDDADQEEEPEDSEKEDGDDSEEVDEEDQGSEEEEIEIDHGEYDTMEQWLDEYEELEDSHEAKQRRLDERKGHEGAADDFDEDEGEDDLEYIQNNLYEDDEDDDGAADYHYKDFFTGKDKIVHPMKKKYNDYPIEDGEDEEEQGKENDDEEDDDDDDEDDEDGEDGDEDEEEEDSEDEDEEGGNTTNKRKGDGKEEKEEEQTKHKKKSQLLQSQISALEDELLGNKSWELRGEVKSQDRPENALLGYVRREFLVLS